MVKLLMKNGAISREDKWGVTPLDEANLSCNEDVIEELESYKCQEDESIEKVKADEDVDKVKVGLDKVVTV
ncbi:unnamed protein product [Lactuca virosa]|uniref:Uncharacterized protein n=1 Tax=Lactuca virosa TaxID=75947 RepID=A0AAU9MF13_9ASTR|nr:unnamed protein product [Lactuca virosa]